MKTVFLGLGSNVGDRLAAMEKALALLESGGVKIVEKSAVYETEPVGVKDQDWFLNMAVRAETGLSPNELLEVVKAAEKEAGRVKTYKWGPRVIDVDILLFDDMIVDNPSLVIPHKFLHCRKFVLKPLSDIAGDRQHPRLKKSIKELLNECEDDSIVRPLF